MKYKITWTAYNNKDLRQSVFRDTEKEALEIKADLERIAHVRDVKIEEVKQ